MMKGLLELLEEHKNGRTKVHSLSSYQPALTNPQTNTRAQQKMLSGDSCLRRFVWVSAA